MSTQDSNDSQAGIRPPADDPEPEPASRSRTAWRRAVLVAGLLLTLLLAVTLVFAVRFRSMLDPEELAARLEPRISNTVNRPVTIDGASLRLWPRPAVRVEGIRIANRGIFSGTALASADAVLLEPRLWPLLRRQVIVDRIVVHSPRLFLVVDENGTSNFGDFVPESETRDPATATGSIGGFSLDIRRLELADGQAAYRDALRGSAIQLDSIDLETDLDLSRKGIIATEGTATAGVVSIRLPRISDSEFAPESATMEWDGRLSLEPGTLELGSSSIEAGALRARLSGRVDSLGSPVRPLDLSLRAEGLALQEFLGPTKWGLLPSGPLDLDLRLTGSVGAGATPEISGLVTVRDGELANEAGRSLVSDLDAEVEIGGGQASVLAVGRLLDGDLSVEGSVVLDSLLPYDLRVRADADVAELLSLNATGTSDGESPFRIGGRLAVDAAVAGTGGDGAAPEIDGMATVTEFEARPEPLVEPIRSDRIDIRLEGESVSWTEVELQLGSARGSTSGRAEIPLGRSDRRDDRPVIDASLHIDRLDLDEILPDSRGEGIGWGRMVFARLGGRSIEGVSAEEIAVSRGQRRPAEPPVAGDLGVKIDVVHSGEMDVTNLEGLLRFGRQRIEIPDLGFMAHGGSGRLAASLELGSGYVEPFGLQLELTDVRAEEWLSRQTPLGRYVSGTMGLELELAGGLDSLLLPDPASLFGVGSFRISDGMIQPNPLSRAIASVVGAAEPTGSSLRSWVSRFSIGDGAVALSDGEFEFAGGEADLGGKVAFDGALDLAARLRPDAATVRSLGDEYLSGLSPEARTLLAASGSPELGLRIEGRLGSPRVTADPESIRRAQEAIVESGRGEIEKRGLDLLRKLTGQAADSADDGGTP
jgi:hypothetical protein